MAKLKGGVLAAAVAVALLEVMQTIALMSLMAIHVLAGTVCTELDNLLTLVKDGSLNWIHPLSFFKYFL